MEVIASVHNLSEMAERPYTLSLIVQQFEAIERWKAEGRRVTGVTLYRHLVLSWLERDRGKHQLTPEHKQALMEHLAAALWRSGQRYWTVGNVEQWLIDFLQQHPEMAGHYHGMGREQLKEDLRTATFLVRDGEDQFRFAHTSLQEFFLAGYLRRALIEDQPDRWEIRQVSRETLDFLGQWLEEQDEHRSAALATLSKIRDAYRPQASELALAYCLMAHRKGYPAPSMSGFQLPGSDLTGWEFPGTQELPLALGNINLHGARLWNTRWRHCQMPGAVLTEADSLGVEFLNCRMPNSDWGDAILEAAVFRECDLSRATFKGVRASKTQWLRCGLRETRGMPETAPAALFALNRPLSSPPPGEENRRVWVANGHTQEVRACAWSPDGRRIVSASGDNTLRIWDAESGQSLRTLTGHENYVEGCAWSPDGRRIVSASWDKTLRIWDAESGQSLRTLTGHENYVRGCAWSPDGRFVASSSYDGTLRIWEAESGDERRHRIYLRRTPDGTTWATIDTESNLILACHPDAWRILGWIVPGPDGFPMILPAESYGPLPSSSESG